MVPENIFGTKNQHSYSSVYPSEIIIGEMLNVLKTANHFVEPSSLENSGNSQSTDQPYPEAVGTRFDGAEADDTDSVAHRQPYSPVCKYHQQHRYFGVFTPTQGTAAVYLYGVG
jgi:hypothetical protein